MRRSLISGLAGLLALVASSASAQDATKKKITFDDHVLPVFRQKCLACHNADKKAGGLDISTYSALMQGGGSGTIVEPGSAADSYLYRLVTHESEPKMPPNSDKMPAEMLATIKDWIDGGLLENSGSRAKVSNKPKVDLTLKTAPSGKPEGPPPMPERLSLETVVRTPNDTAVTSLACSPWAPLVAVAGQKQVLLYNTQTLEMLGALPFPEGVPHVVRFSRSGTLLMAAGGRAAARGRAVVWNVKTGERVFEVGEELDAVLGADLSADQTRIAIGSTNKMVRIFSTADGSLQSDIKKHTDWVYCSSFSPDGVLLASGDRNGGIHVWEAHTGREFLTLTGHTAGITALSWRSDSNILASCSEDGTIKLWEMENGGMVKNWSAHSGGATGVWFTRDGRIASVGRDRVAKLWDQNGGALKQFDAFGDIALRVTFCDETNRIIAGDWTGAIRVWNAADGVKVGELSANPLTLQERLEAAQKAVPEKQAAVAPAAADAQAKAAAAEKIKADLAAATKAVTDTQAQITAATTNLPTAKAAVAKVAGELDAATKNVTPLEQALAAAKEAAAKAQEASAKAPDDKALAEAAANAKKAEEAKTNEVAAAKKLVADKTAESEKAKQAQAATEKALADANAALPVAQKKVADLTPAVKPAEDAAAAAKAAADAAAQAAASAVQQVERWKGEIEFAGRVRLLLEKQAAELTAQDNYQNELATVETIKAEVAKAQQRVVDSQKTAEAALAGLNAGKALVTKTTGELDAAQKNAVAAEAPLPALKESLAKAQEAAGKLPNDKPLADLVAQVKAGLDAKAAAADAAKKAAADKAAELEKAKAALPAMEKAYQDATAAVAAAMKQATDLAATVKPAEDKAAAAKQTADAATAVTNEARKQVDALKTPSDANARAAAK